MLSLFWNFFRNKSIAHIYERLSFTDKNLVKLFKDYIGKSDLSILTKVSVHRRDKRM